MGHLALVLHPHICHSPPPWSSCGLRRGYIDIGKSEGLRSFTGKYRSGHRRACLVYPFPPSPWTEPLRCLRNISCTIPSEPQGSSVLCGSSFSPPDIWVGSPFPSFSYLRIIISSERPCPFWPPVLTSTHITLHSLIIFFLQNTLNTPIIFWVYISSTYRLSHTHPPNIHTHTLEE